MVRLLVFLPFIAIGLAVWAIVDIVLIDENRVRAMPKPAWILVALLPILGPLLWLLVGRARIQRARPARTGPIAPDDDPAFLRQLNKDKEQEERIRDLEERLAELDDDDPKP